MVFPYITDGRRPPLTVSRDMREGDHRTDGASSVFAWRSLSAKMHELADLVYGNVTHAVVTALIGEGHEGEGIA